MKRPYRLETQRRYGRGDWTWLGSYSSKDKALEAESDLRKYGWVHPDDKTRIVERGS